MEPSLFTRIAAAEEELRAIQDILANVLDILAEVKANQDEIRQDPDARRGRAERHMVDQRRERWQRLRSNIFIFARTRFPIQPKIMQFIGLFRKNSMFTLDQAQNEELAFWKVMGRIAITGLVLMTTFVIGLYQLINHS